LKNLIAVAAFAAGIISLTASALPNPADTRMLTEPAVSARNIAFVYAGDFVGGQPRWRRCAPRLTSDVGEESNPVFSPTAS